jgi:hypothetical protein
VVFPPENTAPIEVESDEGQPAVNVGEESSRGGQD